MRILIGLLVCAYAVVALWRMWVAAGPPSGQVHVAPQMWPAWSVTAGRYVTSIALLALAAGGAGTAAGSLLALRVLFWALVASVAEAVTFTWTTLIALGLGLVPVRLGLSRGREAAGEHWTRVGIWLAFAGSVLGVLIAVLIAIWARREIARGERATAEKGAG